MKRGRPGVIRREVEQRTIEGRGHQSVQECNVEPEEKRARRGWAIEEAAADLHLLCGGCRKYHVPYPPYQWRRGHTTPVTKPSQRRNLRMYCVQIRRDKALPVSLRRGGQAPLRCHLRVQNAIATLLDWARQRRLTKKATNVEVNETASPQSSCPKAVDGNCQSCQ